MKQKLFADISSLAPPATQQAAAAATTELPKNTQTQLPVKVAKEADIMEDTAPAPGLERIPKGFKFSTFYLACANPFLTTVCIGLPLGSADAPFFDENSFEVAKFCCLTVRVNGIWYWRM